MDEKLLRDLQEADQQGIRFLVSVWPGDHVYLLGDFREVLKLERCDEIQDCLWVTVMQDGRRTRVRRPELFALPVLLSEEHFNSD